MCERNVRDAARFDLPATWQAVIDWRSVERISGAQHTTEGVEVGGDGIPEVGLGLEIFPVHDVLEHQLEVVPYRLDVFLDTRQRCGRTSGAAAFGWTKQNEWTPSGNTGQQSSIMSAAEDGQWLARTRCGVHACPESC